MKTPTPAGTSQPPVSSQRPNETDHGYQMRVADTQAASGEAAHTLPVRAYQYSFIRCDSQTVTLLHHFAPNGAREVTVNHADFCNASDKGYVEPRSLLTACNSHAALVAERDALRAALRMYACPDPFEDLRERDAIARTALTLSAPPALRDGQEISTHK